MFKRILIPTDGSKLALKGIKAGVKLASALGAKVHGVHVVAPYVPAMYGDAAIYYAPGFTPRDYRAVTEKQAKKALAAVESEARAARVGASTQLVTELQPWEGILKVARAKKCDAIVMASHGRGGLGGLLLG